MEILIQHLRRQLDQKSIDHVNHLKTLGKAVVPVSWENVHFLKSTNQLKAIKTIILNRNSSNDDFVFFFNRAASILISEALDLVEYIPGTELKKTIVTPTNCTLDMGDTFFPGQEVIAVSLVRSGDCFIRSLRRIIPAAKIGKLLIQTDSRTGEPKLHTEKLPSLEAKEGAKASKVLLFDSQTISGAAAIMAIKVLLDHNVQQDQIVLVTYTSTETSIRKIFNAFPKIHLVVACVGERSHESTLISDPDADSNLDSDWWMASRFIDSKYFGTS
ncbi:hypothetical protein PMKS-000895 [Pichia membranifaciens]|uniref:Phosphoribosyltransferase domain-containing protein n=1 Tax=Pichia membranifaciens TaxID=4926 RepID=A0A1Q2YCZ3_9ASCO|nr:hypothetical protein PMKS-000895 [Pichia membranifaciens]